MTSDRPAEQETDVIETLQSLIVAFVLAMAFRGFVLEGFVIPTGSMAPTLMGAHVRFDSPVTGFEYPFDAGPLAELGNRLEASRSIELYDPMVSVNYPAFAAPVGALRANTRMGDRVLVLKTLYTFFNPDRFDVVVFKNPTDPVGDTQNYIKRLVGLPNERILLVDGDVFAGPAGVELPERAPITEKLAGMSVRRKPEHVQRAVWQPVYDSDFVPIDVQQFEQRTRRDWPGPPWRAPGWRAEDRVYRWESANPTEITWDGAIRAINDWTAYNILRGGMTHYPVSDLRIAAAVVADQPDALATTLTLHARRHLFTFSLADGAATIRMAHDEDEAQVREVTAPVDPPAPGEAIELEFWHVDQALSIWINGRRIVELTYDWSPTERIENAFNGRTVEQYARDPQAQMPTPPQVTWSFRGSPVEMRRLSLDRDLYYRPGRLSTNDQFRANGPYIEGLAAATDPSAPLRLGPDHFFMLGDNSPASRDGRMWGRPHQLVAIQLEDETPFVVHRRLLLGKAWAVYFPAPLPMQPGGRAFVPDLGRLRFIR